MSNSPAKNSANVFVGEIENVARLALVFKDAGDHLHLERLAAAHRLPLEPINCFERRQRLGLGHVLDLECRGVDIFASHGVDECLEVRLDAGGKRDCVLCQKLDQAENVIAMLLDIVGVDLFARVIARLEVQPGARLVRDEEFLAQDGDAVDRLAAFVDQRIVVIISSSADRLTSASSTSSLT